MGRVKPIAALVTAAFPGDTPVDSVDKFYKGLETCAQRWKTGFLGGDTLGSRDRWFVSVTVFGEADRRHLVRRTGAQPGDLLIASGPLGLAAAGLEISQKGKHHHAWAAPLVEAFQRPQPRFGDSGLLAERRWATSMMDCSDGLEASARLLALASGVCVALDLTHVSVPAALRRWTKATGRAPWEYVLKGGEDYELLFTASPRHWKAIQRAMPRAWQVGRIESGEGAKALTPAGWKTLTDYGFSHFATS
jgi:thiamine-monophosphate kinase